jgi:tRNA(adenine34) deaminase
MSVMQMLLAEARKAGAAGEVPVAAAIVHASTGEVLATASNRTEADYDPTAHAELLAIKAACAKLKTTRLPECDLVVTLEPCALCAAAISFARIRKVVFGAYDPKGGAIEHGPRWFIQPTCHHAPEVVGGVNESEAAALLRDFFRERRT